MARWFFYSAIFCISLIAIVLADFDVDQLLNDPDDEVREVTQLIKRHRSRFRMKDRDDFTRRLGHFRRHKKNLDGWRKRHRRAKFRLNKFSLMSADEQKQHFGAKLPSDIKPKVKRSAFDSTWSNDIPDSFDFRTSGKVTPIKNQGPCGSCWAFSTAAVIESQYLLRLNQSLDLSEQNLVNCNTGAWGCNGGNVAQTLSYVQKSGITTEACLPYQTANGQCTSQCDSQKYFIGGYNHFGYDESKFAGMLYNYGPAVVTMYVPPEFMLYDSGVLEISRQECIDKNEGLHAMTIVGYTPEVWIIKNSWGTDWGEEGYVRVKRGIDFCAMTLEVAAPYLNSTIVTPATRPPVTSPTPSTAGPTTRATSPTVGPTTRVASTVSPVTTKPTTTTSSTTTTTAAPQTPPTRPQPLTTRLPNPPPTTPYRIPSGCPQSPTFSDANRAHVVSAFNQKRSEMAHGQIQLKSGKRLPPGRNVRKLTYDCRMEQLAQSYAERCVKSQGSEASMALLAFPYNITAKAAIDQISRHLFTFPTNFTLIHRPGGIQVSADNAQFAYDQSTSIGCYFARKACFTESTKAVIACAISPGHPSYTGLYTTGCSACRHDDYCTLGTYRKCDVVLGLCYQ